MSCYYSFDCSIVSIAGTQNKPDLSAHWFELNNRDVFFHLPSCDTVPRGQVNDRHFSQTGCLVMWLENATAKSNTQWLERKLGTSNKVSLDISVADV